MSRNFKKWNRHLLLLQGLVLLFLAAAAETAPDTLSLSKLNNGYILFKHWKYTMGDDPSWASKEFDDSSWKVFLSDTNGISSDSILIKNKGIAWFRMKLYIVDSALRIPKVLNVRAAGACDVYVDGRLAASIGKVSASDTGEVSGFSIQSTEIPFEPDTGHMHVIALRTSAHTAYSYNGIIKVSENIRMLRFNLSFENVKDTIERLKDLSKERLVLFFSGVFLVLCLFHLVLFLYYRKNPLNLYYSLFTLLLFIIFFGTYQVLTGISLRLTLNIAILEIMAVFLVPLFFIGILYQVFYKRLLRLFWILLGLLTISLVGFIFLDSQLVGGSALFLFLITSLVEIIRVFIRAWVKKKDGAGIFLFGILLPVIGSILLGLTVMIMRKAGLTQLAESIDAIIPQFAGYSLLMSVSISMTIYLARDFARMNRKLRDQLGEIKSLFEKTILQENEKKRILENQKAELERQVQERTIEVMQQKSEIEQKNRDILDNLLYARRIQSAILPDTKLIHRVLKESFIIYLPKDIVSGDFYTFSQKENRVILTAADCTGHGVTGAFMSMIGSSLLNQIINERGILQPAMILDQLNEGIADALKQEDHEINDGMDIAVCSLDLVENTLSYAGANRPLWINRGGTLIEIKPDKMAIGGLHIQKEQAFTNHEIEIRTGDILYIFSDGFVDQFGGDEGKKMLSKRLREMLLSLTNTPMREQEKRLLHYFNDWKGTNEQVDDVLLIGVRII